MQITGKARNSAGPDRPYNPLKLRNPRFQDDFALCASHFMLRKLQAKPAIRQGLTGPTTP